MKNIFQNNFICSSIIDYLHDKEDIMVWLAAGIVVIILFVYKLYLPIIKGTVGEARVRRQLNKLPYEEYRSFNDVLINTNRGSCQIDHLVISIYGIYVIETKNYIGWIHGNEKSEYWTQSIYSSKTKFRNPIKQNWGHIYALKNVLSDFRKLTYYPIIVFAGSAKLKNVYSNVPVIYSRRLFKTIIELKGVPLLSLELVENISNKINEVNIQGKRAKKKHVRQVKKNISERKRKERLLICPRCGGDLIIRKGKHGNFYGCSNYPKCKYTKNKQ